MLKSNVQHIIRESQSNLYLKLFMVRSWLDFLDIFEHIQMELTFHTLLHSQTLVVHQ
jgi:hypothetical protein